MSELQILSDTLALLKEQNAKRENVVRMSLPLYYEYPDYTYLGGVSHSNIRSKKRYVLEPSIVKGMGEIVTPSELARAYLDIAHPRKLHATGDMRDAITMPRQPPIYYVPALMRDGVYVDVTSAYLQIMDIVGWDVDYNPNKWLAAGRAPFEFPARHHKVARNCLVTSGLSTSVSVWTGHKLIEVMPQNKHLNYALWALIQDVLNELALEAISWGAVYVNTDGYILHEDMAQVLMASIWETWRIKTRVKHFGQTHVTGVGSYKVGDYKTQRFTTEYSLPYSNVGQRHSVMLQKTFRDIALDRVDRPYRFRL